MTEISKEVEEVLKQENPEFETISDEDSSPLNSPIAEKDIAGSSDQAEYEWQHKTDTDAEPDAPEQIINEDEGIYEDDSIEDQEEFELPTSHAKQAADTFLGMADNFLEVGGGFFIKVKKHADYYEFEEVVQIIDEHNDRNIRRLKLEKEDRVLLRPLLIAVLKKKAKKLTPEQQLAGAVLSILMKKAQIIMEIRAENEIMTDRILYVIREERQIVEDAEGSAGEDTNDDSDAEYEEIEDDAEKSQEQAFPSETVMEVSEED